MRSGINEIRRPDPDTTTHILKTGSVLTYRTTVRIPFVYPDIFWCTSQELVHLEETYTVYKQVQTGGLLDLKEVNSPPF